MGNFQSGSKKDCHGFASIYWRKTVINLCGKLKIAYSNSLYSNAGYLLANSAVMALSGFIFWVAVARFYLPQEVGYAAAILAVAELAATISMLGVDYSIIRFFPSTDNKIKMVNYYIGFILLSSFLAAVIFLFGIGSFFPVIAFIKENIFFGMSFVVLVMLLAVGVFISALFIAQRKSIFVLCQNTITGVLKVAVSIALASVFLSFGIISAVTAAVIVSAAVSIFVFFPRVLRGFKLFPMINPGMLSEIWRYSIGSYFAALLYALPLLVLPLVVITLLGPEQNAYFYIVWGISNALCTAAATVSFSLFAEGSHSTGDLSANIIRSIKFLGFFLVPIVLIFALTGKWILLAFGESYSESGWLLFRILCATVIQVGIVHIYVSVLRVKDRIKEMISMWAISAVSVIAASYYCISIFGIVGVGYSWFGVQTLIATYSLIKIKLVLRNK